MRRKLLALILAAMCAFLLVSCGVADAFKKGYEEAAAESRAKEAQAAAETQTEVKAEAESPAEKETQKETETAASQETAESGSYGNPYVEEQLLYDKDGVRISAIGIGVDDLPGMVSLYLKLENNTDKRLTVVCPTGEDVLVNGIAVDNAIAISAGPGETREEGALLMQDSLNEKGIDKIETIEFALTGVDGDYEDVFKTDVLKVEVGSGGAASGSLDKASVKDTMDKADKTTEKKDEKSSNESGKGAGTYNYFGFYVDGTYIDGDDPELDPWYVTLKDDGTGYLYFGEDNKGDITEWSGWGDDFTMKAGISVFGDRSFLNDGVLALDFDEYVILFTTKDADLSKYKVMTADEYSEQNK